MKSEPNNYFVIKDAKQVGGKMIISGEMIIEGVPSAHDAKERSLPQIKGIKPFEVKWILPPRGSRLYEGTKAFAEGMGYDTVEYDDFSYPPSRI